MRARTRIGGRLIRATVFRAASIERWKDAECLQAAGRFQGAIYMSGYALECELKYCVCSARRVEALEVGEAKVLGHSLGELFRCAGKMKLLSRNQEALVAFERVNSRWSTDIRYSGRGGNSEESERFLSDTRALLFWLTNESNS